MHHPSISASHVLEVQLCRQAPPPDFPNYLHPHSLQRQGSLSFKDGFTEVFNAKTMRKGSCTAILFLANYMKHQHFIIKEAQQEKRHLPPTRLTGAQSLRPTWKKGTNSQNLSSDLHMYLPCPPQINVICKKIREVERWLTS